MAGSYSGGQDYLASMDPGPARPLRIEKLLAHPPTDSDCMCNICQDPTSDQLLVTGPTIEDERPTRATAQDQFGRFA